jgi:hypothetical protein
MSTAPAMTGSGLLHSGRARVDVAKREAAGCDKLSKLVDRGYRVTEHERGELFDLSSKEVIWADDERTRW